MFIGIGPCSSGKSSTWRKPFAVDDVVVFCLVDWTTCSFLSTVPIERGEDHPTSEPLETDSIPVEYLSMSDGGFEPTSASPRAAFDFSILFKIAFSSSGDISYDTAYSKCISEQNLNHHLLHYCNKYIYNCVHIVPTCPYSSFLELLPSLMNLLSSEHIFRYPVRSRRVLAHAAHEWINEVFSTVNFRGASYNLSRYSGWNEPRNSISASATLPRILCTRDK